MNSIDSVRPRLRVRNPADLLAVVPYLLGFHPSDSLVLVAIRGGSVVFAGRADLPGPEATEAVVHQLAGIAATHGASHAILICYGPSGGMDHVAPALRRALAAHSVHLLDMLRVHDGRYTSLICGDPGCCPPEGTPFDATTSPLAAAATFAGHEALPDRAALVARLAPLGGPGRESMTRAVERARRRMRELPGDRSGADRVDPAAMRGAGVAAVDAALARARAGAASPDDDETAWLTLLLEHTPVRDHAWARIDHEEWQVRLWTDIVRRAEPGLAPAPASLLAFAAWRAGNGSLAAVAVERALRAEPAYPMARLLDEVLRRGVSPADLEPWPPAGLSPAPSAGAGDAGADTR